MDRNEKIAAIIVGAGASIFAALALIPQKELHAGHRKARSVAKNHRVFISFAAEDVRYRDLLVGQARNSRTPFNFVDMSVKQPWDSSWKTNCLTKIKGCDGLIALISKNTPKASGAIWEIQAAKQQGLPVLGLWITDTDRTSVSDIPASRTKPWTWANISSFLGSL